MYRHGLEAHLSDILLSKYLLGIVQKLSMFLSPMTQIDFDYQFIRFGKCVPCQNSGA